MPGCCLCKIKIELGTTDAAECAYGYAENCCVCAKEKAGWISCDENGCRQCKARMPESKKAAAETDYCEHGSLLEEAAALKATEKAAALKAAVERRDEAAAERRDARSTSLMTARSGRRSTTAL